MKLKLLLLLLFAVQMNAFSQSKTAAETTEIAGVPVFIYSNPATEYETVGKAIPVGKVIMIAANEKVSLTEKIKETIESTNERVKKGKLTKYDAIIIDVDKDKTWAIKFKGEPSLDATVVTVENIPVFLLTKPKTPYEVVAQFPADYSHRASKGVLYDKVNSMVKRALKKQEEGGVEKFDAIIFDPQDLSETLIRFK